MISCILNTDMSKHFETVEKIKTLSKRFIQAGKYSDLIEINRSEIK